MRIHWLQHVSFEGLGSIATWASERGHELVGARLWAEDPLPDASEVKFLIIMGGPMSATDDRQYEWLSAEKKLVREVIDQGAVVLGICLGAQLIAAALGASVMQNHFKEIGWYPVTLTPDASNSPIFETVPSRFQAFHWHGETFEIPEGATHIAQSAACTNQAFVINDRIVALQFHLEILPENVEALIENCREELTCGQWIQDIEKLRAGAVHATQHESILNEILDRLSSAAEP